MRHGLITRRPATLRVECLINGNGDGARRGKRVKISHTLMRGFSSGGESGAAIASRRACACAFERAAELHADGLDRARIDAEPLGDLAHTLSAARRRQSL